MIDTINLGGDKIRFGNPDLGIWKHDQMETSRYLEAMNRAQARGGNQKHGFGFRRIRQYLN